MKIDRLIGIITLLLREEKVTAPALAERFEVSRRTINRDIEDICKAGIPIVTMQGYRGGITIAEGYKIDKTFFTRDELEDILTGLKGMDSVSASSRLRHLLIKLTGKEVSAPEDHTVVIDLASHYQDSLTAKIELLKKAASEYRMVTFDYYYPKGECKRSIEPYRIMFKWSSWYVFGYCTERSDFRLFKLNRLWKLSIMEQRFKPRELPLNELNPDSRFSRPEYILKAVFEPKAKYRLIEEYGPKSFTADADGRLHFERGFADYENMLQWIMSFGDQVFVEEPEELISELLAQAENLVMKYKNT